MKPLNINFLQGVYMKKSERLNHMIMYLNDLDYFNLSETINRGDKESNLILYEQKIGVIPK